MSENNVPADFARDLLTHQSYIIGISYNDDQAPVLRDNLDLFLNKAEEANADFQLRLQTWLNQQGYHPILEFGKPIGLPILSVRCTAETAELIKRHPQVDFVRPNGIRIAHDQ